MEKPGISGTWINSKNPNEEIRISDDDDYYTLEYNKDENGFQSSEEISMYWDPYPYGYFQSHYFGDDSHAYCDGKTLRVNDFVFIRK